MFALLPASLAAEGSVSNAPAARPANRYLFVVETSRSMQRRSDAVLKSIQNMLGTAMGGQLHRGDTVGIWTYDSDIHSGRFPLQLWTPEMQKAITLRAMGFLNDQSYQKTGRLLKVLPILDRVVKSSDFITVVLITGGDEPITGTPFDGAINDSFNLWRDQQEASKAPFVTVLRGKGGRLTDYSVNPAPWPVEMPPLPLELVQAPAAPAPKPAPKPPPPMAAPLIISGRKTNAPPAAATSTPPASNALPSPTVPSTNATPGQPPGAGTVTQKSDEAARPATPVAAPIQVVSNSAQLTPPSEKGPIELVKTESNLVAAASAPRAGPIFVTETNTPAKAPAPDPAPTVEPSVAPEIPATTAVTSAAAIINTSAPAAPTAPDPTPDGPKPAQTASAMPSGRVSVPGVLWVGIAGLAVVALGSAILLVRRARSVPKASLITRSLDRDKRSP